MYTDEQFEKLEQEEREITDEAILIILLLLANTRGNLEKELRDFYSKYGRDGVVTYAEARKWVSEQDHRRRITALTVVIGSLFLDVLSQAEGHFRRFLIDVITKEAIFFGVTVDVDALLLRKWGFDNLYWLERLTADVDLWNATILKDLKQAMLKGSTIDDLVAQLNKRFSSINSVLKTLGLSESTAVGSMSRQAIFKELGVEKYRFYTREDERTCETCGAMHGLIFPMSAYEIGVTASPLHPRCRCWEVPILE